MSDVITAIAVEQVAAYVRAGWTDTGRRYHDVRGAMATVRWPAAQGPVQFPPREGSSEGNAV